MALHDFLTFVVASNIYPLTISRTPCSAVPLEKRLHSFLLSVFPAICHVSVKFSTFYLLIPCLRNLILSYSK